MCSVFDTFVCKVTEMKILLVVVILLGSFCACHAQKNDFNVIIDTVEYTNIPAALKLNDKIVFSGETMEILRNITQDFKAEPFAGTEAILNDYADKIFANLQSLMVHQGLDPMALPDQHAGFNYTIIITFHGELDLTSGWLMDISTIHRGGDVIVHYSTSDKYLSITVPIAFDDLQFTYDYSAKIMNLGPTGGITGKIANIGIQVKLGFDTANLVASLDEFIITNSGHIDINFVGNPLIDWLINLLTDVVTALLKPLILLIVENIIRGGLEGAVDAINSAIGGFLNPTTPAPSTTIASLFVN